MTNPKGAYSSEIIALAAREEFPLEQATNFNCKGPTIRHPKETKGIEYKETRLAEGEACDCGPNGC